MSFELPQPLIVQNTEGFEDGVKVYYLCFLESQGLTSVKVQLFDDSVAKLLSRFP